MIGASLKSSNLSQIPSKSKSGGKSLVSRVLYCPGTLLHAISSESVQLSLSSSISIQYSVLSSSPSGIPSPS